MTLGQWTDSPPALLAAIVGGIVIVLALAWTGTRLMGHSGPPATGSGLIPDTGPRTAAIGSQVRETSVSFTVRRLKTGQQTAGRSLMSPTRGQFVSVYLSVSNLSEEPARVNDRIQWLFDGMGARYEPDTRATAAASGKKSATTIRLGAGRTATRILVYDIPADAVPTKIVVHGTKSSKGVVIAL